MHGNNEAISGSVKVLQAFGAVQGDASIAEISLTAQSPKSKKAVENRYMVRKIDSGFELRPLEGKRALACYHVNAEMTTCDCADGTYRPNRVDGCKHLRAVKALRSRGLV